MASAAASLEGRLMGGGGGGAVDGGGAGIAPIADEFVVRRMESEILKSFTQNIDSICNQTNDGGHYFIAAADGDSTTNKSMKIKETLRFKITQIPEDSVFFVFFVFCFRFLFFCFSKVGHLYSALFYYSSSY